MVNKDYCDMWLKQLLVVLVAGTVVGMAEARPRRIDPTVGRALGGFLNQISTAQRESEMRANQEAARLQKLERERQQQQLAEQRRLQKLEKDRQQQFQAEQRRLQREAEARARELEVQRKKAEADAAKAEAQRLESLRLQRLSEEQRMQRQLAEDRQRQLEMERQKLALDRQRWKEEADHDGWFFLGVHIPSWLWKSIAGSLAFAILWGIIKKPFSK